jgi:hypothetical protein
MAEANEIYFSLSTAVEQPVRMRFADGDHMVPGFMVAQLGGEDELRGSAAALSEITFAQFSRAVADENTGSYLRRIHNRMINDHLRGF